MRNQLSSFPCMNLLMQGLSLLISNKPHAKVASRSASRSRRQAAAECATAALPACIVCGGDEFAAPHAKRLPWLKSCNNCGLAMNRPQPTDAELESIYSEDYYAGFGFDDAGESAFRRLKQAAYASLLAFAEARVPGGRLLDVGSALGDSLAAARRRGWTAHGVEPNEFAVAKAEEVAPAATFFGPLEAFSPPQCHFDLVTCLEVIEHLRRPDEALEMMFAILRPGGALLVTTPDSRSINARLLGERWPHFHIDHLWYFARGHLASLAQAHGAQLATLDTGIPGAFLVP